MYYLKIKSEWIYPVATFLLIFLIRFPMIHLELEAGDEGFNLVNQQLSSILTIQHYINALHPFWWFSDLISSCWLKLTNPYGLWGARLGGVLCNCLIGLMAVKTISLVYKPNLALSLVIAGISLYSQTAQILYYDSIPELLFVVFAFLFLKATIDPSNRFYQILCGLSLSILVLSKCTMVSCLLIPILTYLMCLYLDKDRSRSLVSTYFWMLTIAATVLFFYGAILIYNHFTSDVLFKPPSPNHTFSYQLRHWYNQLRNKIPLVIVFFGFPFILYAILQRLKIRNRLSISILFFLSLFLASRAFSIFHAPKWYFPFMYQDSTYILMYFLIAISCATCIYILRSSATFKEYTLLLLALLFPIFQALGSAVGISKVFMGMWLLDGIMICLFQRVSNNIGCENCKAPLYLLSSALIANIFYSGYIYSYYCTYNANELTAECTAPRLKGIYTTPGREVSFDALLAEIAKYAKKGDSILAYEYFSLVYFASDTLPFANRSHWIWLPSDILKSKIEETFSKFPPPVLVVRSKTDKTSTKWGLKDLPLVDHPDPQFRDFVTFNMNLLDEAIREKWNIELVWSNLDFDLYLASTKTGL